MQYESYAIKNKFVQFYQWETDVQRGCLNAQGHRTNKWWSWDRKRHLWDNTFLLFRPVYGIVVRHHEQTKTDSTMQDAFERGSNSIKVVLDKEQP